jgi:hypothetical protein
MTDKEFVISVYEDAKYSFSVDPRDRKNSSIEITMPDGRYRAIGWCCDKTEEMTWFYARHDIESEMLRKLENL